MPLEYSNVGVGNAGTSSTTSHLYHQQLCDDVSFPREPLENNAGREDTLTQLQVVDASSYGGKHNHYRWGDEPVSDWSARSAQQH